MIKKIYLSAGHGLPKDPGASGNGYIEANLTTEQRQLIAEELEILGICPEVDRNTNILQDTINFFKSLVTPSCILVDLHWNSSSNPKATGVEVFIPTNYTELELEIAGKIAKCISDTLDIPLRGNTRGVLGVKTEDLSARRKLAWMRITGQNILIETCFISNKNDMQKYQENKRKLAFKIAKILYDYATK